jgi:hypothetical protein
MTFNDITYMVLEMLRKNYLVDDENLSILMIENWVNMKRDQYIRNSLSTNPNDRIDLSLYQSMDVVVDVKNVEDAGDYPFINSTTQLYEIVESTTTIPTLIEGKSGPLILSVESEDLMKFPFTMVDYDELRFVGNGKFTHKFIYGAVRDNKMYFKYNSYFDTYQTVKLRAVFIDPREVTGFDSAVTRYPANDGLVEYIKNGIFDKDVRALLIGKADTVNDASGIVQ